MSTVRLQEISGDSSNGPMLSIAAHNAKSTAKTAQGPRGTTDARGSNEQRYIRPIEDPATDNSWWRQKYNHLNTAMQLQRTIHMDRRRDLDSKKILSKALKKANAAVTFDKAMDYRGAVESYQDTCFLLLKILDIYDYRKLDAIGTAYTIRVEEILQIQMSVHALSTRLLDPPPTTRKRPIDYTISDDWTGGSARTKRRLCALQMNDLQVVFAFETIEAFPNNGLRFLR